MHTYAGVHLLAKPLISLVMLSASTPSSAAAVWAGASTPNAHRWVQAGIASIGDQPFLYAESNSAHYRLMLSPWTYGRPACIRVIRRGSRWRASVGSLRTPWLRLRNGIRMDALELIDGAHARALIGGRLVSG